LEGTIMLLGALVPFHDTGGDPDTVRESAQAREASGYDFLEAPDHVLGANVASGRAGTLNATRRRTSFMIRSFCWAMCLA
jgi:hypothetical protein